MRRDNSGYGNYWDARGYDTGRQKERWGSGENNTWYPPRQQQQARRGDYDWGTGPYNKEYGQYAAQQERGRGYPTGSRQENFPRNLGADGQSPGLAEEHARDREQREQLKADAARGIEVAKRYHEHLEQMETLKNHLEEHERAVAVNRDAIAKAQNEMAASQRAAWQAHEEMVASGKAVDDAQKKKTELKTLESNHEYMGIDNKILSMERYLNAVEKEKKATLDEPTRDGVLNLIRKEIGELQERKRKLLGDHRSAEAKNHDDLERARETLKKHEESSEAAKARFIPVHDTLTSLEKELEAKKDKQADLHQGIRAAEEETLSRRNAYLEMRRNQDAWKAYMAHMQEGADWKG